MVQKEIFDLIYDGDPVDNGSMDVRDLAPSLLALSDLFGAVNEVVFDGKAAIFTKVHADFKTGSFHIKLELGQTLFGTIVDLFSNKESSAIANMLGIVGGSISAPVGFLAFLAWLKGKKPKSASPVGDRFLIVASDGRTMEIPKQMWPLYFNPKARKAAEEFVRPLKEIGMKAIKIGRKNTPEQLIDKSEVEYFDAPRDKAEETTTESETLLNVMTVQFKDGRKWRFSDGSAEFTAGIRDEAFLRRASKDLAFTGGDLLRVKLQTTQWQENGTLKSSREIIQVLEHRKPNGEQQGMAFLPPDPPTHSPS
jgi:hypothetical protein